MRPSLRILAVLIPAFSLALLATSLLGSGAWTAFEPQSEAALALARRFETTSWITLAGLQVVAAMAGIVPASLVGVAAGALFGVLTALRSQPPAFFWERWLLSGSAGPRSGRWSNAR